MNHNDKFMVVIIYSVVNTRTLIGMDIADNNDYKIKLN